MISTDSTKPFNSDFNIREVTKGALSQARSKKYDRDEFGRLYHYRRNEEEAYKLLKARVELEAFSGKTARL